jgi:sugar lactone lactonase YvrE
MSAGLAPELAVRASAQTGESPLWDSGAGRLHWTDIAPGAVHSSDLDSGTDSCVVYRENVSALALAAGGGLDAAMRRGYARITPGGLDSIQEVLPGGYQMNDAKCDPHGRFLSGGPRLDFAPGHGSLWAWEPGHPPCACSASWRSPTAWSGARMARSSTCATRSGARSPPSTMT